MNKFIYLIFCLFLFSFARAQNQTKNSIITDSLINLELNNLKNLNKDDNGNINIFKKTYSKIARMYFKEQKYNFSKDFYLKALAQDNDINIDKELQLDILKNLINTYDALDSLPLAEKYAIESVRINKIYFGERSNQYALSLNNLASVYGKKREYLTAVEKLKQSIDVYLSNPNIDTSNYILSLNNLRLTYKEIGDLKNILKYSNTLKEYLITIGRNIDTNYGELLYDIAFNFHNLGNDNEADLILNECLSLEEMLNSKESKNYSRYLGLKAVIKNTQNKPDEAINIYKYLLVIRKKIFDNDPIIVATTLQNIAYTYINLDSLQLAESFYEQSLSTYGNKNKNNYYYTVALNNFSAFYLKIGQLKKAEILINESLEIYNNTLGKDHHNYATTIATLVSILIAENKFQQAKVFQEEVVKIRKDKLGEKNPNYIKSLINLAVIYKQLGFYDLSKETNKKALTADVKLDAVMLATLNSNYANDNYLSGENVIADSLYLVALNIELKYFGNRHSRYLHSLFNYLQFKHKTNQKINFNYLSNLIKENRNYLIQQNEYLSNNELITNLNSNNTFNYDGPFSIGFKSNYLNDSLTSDFLNLALTLKNNSLITYRKAIDNIRKNGDTILNTLVDELQKNKKAIANVIDKKILDKDIFIEKLESQSEKLEKQIFNGSKSLNNIKNESKINWKNIQNMLESTDVAIEFISFNYYDENWKRSNQIYGAFIIKKEVSKPKYISLFDTKDVYNVLNLLDNTDEVSFYNNLYTYKMNGKNLYDLVWKKLENELVGTKKIYISATGVLNNLNLGKIPINDTISLDQLYEFHNVNTISDIINNKYNIDVALNNLLIFGGIDYDNIATTNNKTQAIPNSLQNRSYKNSNEWEFLPNTLYESITIDSLFLSQNKKSKFVFGKLASKNEFKKLTSINQPFILHIATHAFFNNDFEERDSLNETTSNNTNYLKLDNPLLKTGLIFSGANIISDSINNENDDGILTSYEISNLSLENAKLVVLSACETALGFNQGNEGIYGLQRALKLAGVKYIIMSNWKVPDIQTFELMTLFYRNLLNKQQVSEALSNAQFIMSKKYPPYFWAAFKLLE